MKAALLAMAVASGLFASAASAAGRCGSAPWCDTRLPADERAGLLLGALTDEEKTSLLAGDELFGVAGGEGSHTGTSHGVERVGLPTTYYSDGPVGPRSGRATSMPAPMALAATFNRSLAFRHGSVIGNEVKSKGNDVVFAPTVNLLRTPLGGRSFEAYGEDPYMQARIGVAWIRGAQSQGVIGNIKHYAVNNQEGQGPGTLAGGSQGSRQTVDAVVDERTLREMYLSHFEAAVKEADVGSVMCAYNRVNGHYACENEHLLEDVLKGEWGFKGYVLADYAAGRSTANSLENGLDFEPWPGLIYSPTSVNLALATGQASQAVVDEHVRRILRTLFAYGFFDRDAYLYDDNRIDKPGHARAARQIEEAGIVLMKNAGVLPLDRRRVRSIALIGSDAEKFTGGGGSSQVAPFFFTTPRQGIETRAARAGVQVSYDSGQDPERAASVAAGADVAVVVAADSSSEGTDKPCMGLECGREDGLHPDELISRVAAANKRTVVVLETGAPVLTPWRDEVAGLIEAWYPGVEGGSAIARVLFGDVDPGGRLPATFPKREEDMPYAGDREAYPGVAERVVYKEGVLVGYRWFDEKRIEPAFPFGHGLSYARFRYRNLRLLPASDGSARATVTVRVTNTGRRAGSEVPQLYLGMPDPRAGVVQPPRALRGFANLRLRPGQTKTARFRLGPRAFSYWDEVSADWRVAPGCYRVMIGRSSRDVRLAGTLSQGGARCPRACATAAGFRSASIRPRGRGLRFRFARRGARRVTIDVFQQARGQRVIRPRLVARFRRSRALTWRGRANRRARVGDGYLFARLRTRGRNGRLDSRYFALRRSGGRFSRRPAFRRRASCGPIRAFRLSGPSFGGSGGRPLGIAYRLGSRARVRVVVLRGRRVVRRFRVRVRRGGRTYRFRVPSRGLPPGEYRVRLAARGAGVRKRVVLRSRLL
jgi:beta-glucosidase